MNRLPKVSLTVLRLAIGEMLYFRDIPVAATINEAVELAKKYSMQEDAALYQRCARCICQGQQNRR